MFVGREREKKELEKAYEANESRFVAVYGRRRVGKTYLVRTVFKDRLLFSHAGLEKGSYTDQLYAWKSSLEDAGMAVATAPKSWLEAFDLLKKLIRQSKAEKKVIFLDELPWMDTPRSKFVSALEFFWNSWASGRNDVLLIVCGSATSWIINNLFKNHGGLHNRVTDRIFVEPFTLAECREYSHTLNLSFTDYDIIVSYMVMGGIPFYWSLLEKGKSLAQNIDSLFFNANGKLAYEFTELYDSLFRNANNYIEVVKILGEHTSGMTRDEIIAAGKLQTSGTLSRVLEDLEHCGFIRRFNALGTTRNAIYQLIDNYTLFYFKFISENKTNDENFWSHNISSPIMSAWTGLAFERVCFQHIRQIKSALGISGIMTNVCSWKAAPTKDGKRGAQIDMLIDRADNMIDLCEMKFSSREFVVTQDVMENIQNKVSRLQEAVNGKKGILITLVTVYGLAHRGYWNEIQNVVTAEDLFKE